ncbi:MAG: hypothetical protein WD070_02845, partial [Pirellulaceae bacterium]
MFRLALSSLLSITLVSVANVSTSEACPFCAAVSQTFTEEIDSMDAVVIGELVKLPKKSDEKDEVASRETPKATFQIVQIIKGGKLLLDTTTIETIYFGDGQLGKPFLIMGVDPPKIMWSTPLQLTDRARKYIPELLALPKEGVARLEFFQKHLEDDDEMLARDAYDEFAKAPYETVIALKPKMDHEQLVEWIQDG